MTRILVQRGSSGSSSSSSNNRPSTSVSVATTQVASNTQGAIVKDENIAEEVHEEIFHNEVQEDIPENRSEGRKTEDLATKNVHNYQDEVNVLENEIFHGDPVNPGNAQEGLVGLSILDEKDTVGGNSIQMMTGTSNPPPPPPAPPLKHSSSNSVTRISSSDSAGTRPTSFRRNSGWAGVSIRSSPNASHPSSPRSHCDGEGYNSADEQSQSLSSYNDAEREHHFEIELRRIEGLEVRKMLEDGNCLFRAVADQVYGDSELYDLVRQLCIDYMERERNHFSQFITEGFTSYCKRKRRDKVYGNNIEIQALSEMYNRPIHIYSYSAEPINIFHGNYTTDTPPIRLSYHHGNHYNSLVDPRQLNIGAGLGFSSLQGANIDKDQVKAAIKAQQDQQIDNALVAEGRFYSDLELTEKEIERMVMEASRAEYLAGNKLKHEVIHQESSTSRAEPSSSTASREGQSPVLSSSVQVMLAMGFSYMQVMEAHGIFGDDVDAMVCYLIEISGNGRRKGKAAE